MRQEKKPNRDDLIQRFNSWKAGYLLKTSYQWVENPEVVYQKIKNLVVEGLTTDGEHHKQWYLEQVLIILGVDLEDLRTNGYTFWDKGIAP